MDTPTKSQSNDNSGTTVNTSDPTINTPVKTEETGTGTGTGGNKCYRHRHQRLEQSKPKKPASELSGLSPVNKPTPTPAPTPPFAPSAW